jgi:hypothetical protein
MNKQLLTLVFVFFFSVAYAQQYIPFPTDNARWQYRLFDRDMGGTIVADMQYFVNGEDTIIDNISYHKVMSRECGRGSFSKNSPVSPSYPTIQNGVAAVPDAIAFGIRESNKKVYLKLLSSPISRPEILLYDFNLQVGDSVSLVSYNLVYSWASEMYKAVVSRIDSILIGGVYHKRYFADSCLYGHLGYSCIEGIGSTGMGLLPGLSSDDHAHYYCFVSNATSLSNDIPSLCNYIFPFGTPTSVTGEPQALPLSIHPNPFNDHVIVDGLEDESSVSVYSCYGQKIKELRQLKNVARIDLSYLSAGIYYLVISNKAGIQKKEKIVKVD